MIEPRKFLQLPVSGPYPLRKRKGEKVIGAFMQKRIGLFILFLIVISGYAVQSQNSKVKETGPFSAKSRVKSLFRFEKDLEKQGVDIVHSSLSAKLTTPILSNTPPAEQARRETERVHLVNELNSFLVEARAISKDYPQQRAELAVHIKNATVLMDRLR